MLSANLPAVLIIGIDENGLGPVLGPLVVTATAFEAETYVPEYFWKAAGVELVADDSKRIFAASRKGTAEVATLAWLRAFGIIPLKMLCTGRACGPLILRRSRGPEAMNGS